MFEQKIVTDTCNNIILSQYTGQSCQHPLEIAAWTM